MQRVKWVLWNAVSTLFLTATLMIVATLVVHERVRWTECVSHCTERKIHNENLLHTDMCKHDTHLHYGEDAIRICKNAQLESQVWQIACVARAFWKTSEPHRLYAMYAESHWMLFGLSAVFIAVVIHQLFACCFDKGKRKEDSIVHQPTTITLPERQASDMQLLACAAAAAAVIGANAAASVHPSLKNNDPLETQHYSVLDETVNPFVFPANRNKKRHRHPPNYLQSRYDIIEEMQEKEAMRRPPVFYCDEESSQYSTENSED
jgi:membrane protein YdbS with pleckstrin-like domain